MNRKSASTLIYFSERTRRRNLVKKPKHINREKRRATLKHIVLGLLTLATIGFGIWAYVKYKPFDIVRTQIDGAQRFINRQDVKNIVDQQVLGKNCLTLDTNALEKTIEATFLAAKSVKATRILPNALKVQLTERVPIALIQDDAFYFVDSDGFVLGLADKSTTNLPVINYSQKVEVGKFVEPSAVSYYFDLIKALDEDDISVSTISSFPRYTAFFTGDIAVLFTNAQSAKSQVKIFAKMIEAFKTEGRKPKKIDLRFDKVIVEFVDDKIDEKSKEEVVGKVQADRDDQN